MRCAKCGTESTSGRPFCPECGNRLSKRCAKCGADNSAAAKFCEDCGTALGAPVLASERKPNDSPIRITETPGAESREGERKTVTALFADIKGSTELMEDLDPEDARAIVDPALKLMIAAVRRYDGYVVQSTGDGIFALFGAPVAHEDHPQRALHAALRMQEELRQYSSRLVADGGIPIQGRVGANTGEVVVRSIATGGGHTEYTPIGHTANLASRMQAVAPVGSIAVSESTRKLVEGYFALKPMGPTRVKGLSEPVNVYEVTGLGPLRTRLQRSAGRGLTKFVGREREMEALKRALDRARGGQGQIVAAMAEAGVGKSRLFHEFKATSQAGWMVLEAFSVSHGKASAYLPVIDLLRSYFRIASEDDDRTRREKVAGKVTVLDRALEDTLPYLFSLLGIAEGGDPLAQMDGQIKKRRTLEAIKRIVLRESQNQPLMVVFEDLHWMDGESEALLNLLADSIETARILLLVNYRPEYSHQWGGKTNYTQLRLDPLERVSADEMLDALLDGGDELTPLKRLIVEKTEGNPFFMEEIVQGLFEEGMLARNGEVMLARPLSAIRIPATVQAMLAARIDRLPAEEKELLQTLAVLGREFTLSHLKATTEKSDKELEGLLGDLQAAEFIYEQPAAGDVEWAFKHALTQEVAYNSVLIERRKLLHERAAEGVRALFADSIDDHIAELAHHYSRSGNDAQAVDYLIRAGDQAHQRAAFAQAGAYFEDALVRLKRLPESAERDRKEIAIHTGLADVTILTSGYAGAEYERHLTRRYELAERLGDTTQIFYALVGISVLSAFRLELGKALEIGRKLVALAEKASDAEMELQAHGSLANVLWLTGDFVGAREHSEKGLALFARDEHLPPGTEHMRAACLIYESMCTATLGFEDQGLQRSLRFLAWARERAEPLPLAFALNCVATVHGWRREAAEALKYADDLLTLAEEHGFITWHAFARVGHGLALANLGKPAEAIGEIEEALAACEATGAAAPGWVYASLALAYLAAARPAEGIKVAAKGLRRADETGDAEAKPELYRVKGELLLMRDPSATAEAEGSFRAAIDTARKQQARLSELRATMDLARLIADQGRRDEARRMLAAIYGWFTEGFDTADMKDAKAMLEALDGQA